MQALELAKNAGVDIDGIVDASSQTMTAATCESTSSDVEFRFELKPKAEFPPDHYALYVSFDTRQPLHTVIPHQILLTNKGRYRIRISDEILDSDEEAIAVVAHEVNELEALDQEFAANGGQMTLGQLDSLINVLRGTLHCAAWEFSDDLVRDHRG